MNGIDLVGARFQDWRALERARCIECVYQKVFLFRMHEKVTFGFAKHFLSTHLEFIARSLQVFWKKIQERSEGDFLMHTEKKNFLDYTLNLARQLCQVRSLIENHNQIQRFLVHTLNLARALVRASLENARQLC